MLPTFFLFLSLSALLLFFFFFNDTATTEIYTLSLHDALPICGVGSSHRCDCYQHDAGWGGRRGRGDDLHVAQVRQARPIDDGERDTGGPRPDYGAPCLPPRSLRGPDRRRSPAPGLRRRGFSSWPT